MRFSLPEDGGRHAKRDGGHHSEDVHGQTGYFHGCQGGDPIHRPRQQTGHQPSVLSVLVPPRLGEGSRLHHLGVGGGQVGCGRNLHQIGEVITARVESNPMARDKVWRAAVITLSDGVIAGTRQDRSGDVLSEMLGEAGYEIGVRKAVEDTEELIVAALVEACGEVDLVVTTGGHRARPAGRNRPKPPGGLSTRKSRVLLR